MSICLRPEELEEGCSAALGRHPRIIGPQRCCRFACPHKSR